MRRTCSTWSWTKGVLACPQRVPHPFATTCDCLLLGRAC